LRDSVAWERSKLAATVFVALLITGCPAIWAGKPPPCPVPSYSAISDLETWMTDEPNSALEGYISSIEAYCRGIAAMRVE
jgi:hypothetical protein